MATNNMSVIGSVLFLVARGEDKHTKEEELELVADALTADVKTLRKNPTVVRPVRRRCKPYPYILTQVISRRLDLEHQLHPTCDQFNRRIPKLFMRTEHGLVKYYPLARMLVSGFLYFCLCVSLRAGGGDKTYELLVLLVRGTP